MLAAPVWTGLYARGEADAEDRVKITTRITVGYATLIALLAGLVIYEVVTIRRMASINHNLSRVDFQTSVDCLQLMRDRDLLEEYARKAYVLRDPDYLAQLKNYQEDFEAALQKIQSAVMAPEQQTETKRLMEFWRGFSSDLSQQPPEQTPSGVLPPALQEDLERLQAQALTVYQANSRSIMNAAEESNKTGEMARLISWCAAVAALILSALVSFLIYRSISIPLAHLTEGTRAIAEGKFHYRLDTSRNDEFAQLAKDFNAMIYRLNELDELKKAFISHVSHELKAPLASMRETIQLILDGVPGPLTGKQRRLLELNLQSGARLTSMISNLLDLSKIEAGVMEYQLESRDLAPLVRNAVAVLEGQAREKSLTVETQVPEHPLRADCDGDRIIQVLVNLIGNAVKFAPSGSAVKVCLQQTGQLPSGLPSGKLSGIRQGLNGNVNGFVLLSISDLGPGVPDCEKERIFEKFQQVKQSEKGVGQGVGLGLTICRTIVEAHGGAIWVEDNAPRGSVFRILLQGSAAGHGVVRRASTPI